VRAQRVDLTLATVDLESHEIGFLRSLDEFSETDAGLPYSLWALPD
jgi:hypothetical protein